MNTLFITGGTGFFGKSLLKFWKQKSRNELFFDHAFILSRDPKKFQTEHLWVKDLDWLTFVQGDVCEYDSLPHDKTFTHIIHAATESTNGLALHPFERFDQIVTGSKNILEFAKEKNVKKNLITSSGGVYGDLFHKQLPFHESYNGCPDPLNPDSAYSIGKKTTEHLASLYYAKFRLNTVIARGFSFVGEDLPLDAHFAIGNFIKDALFNDCINVNGDGESVRSYLYQLDMAEWIETMLLHGKVNTAYNLGSDEYIKIKDLAYLIRDTLSPEKKVNFKNKIPSQRPWYVPEITRATSELGLEVKHSLKESIIKTAKELVSV